MQHCWASAPPRCAARMARVSTFPAWEGPCLRLCWACRRWHTNPMNAARGNPRSNSCSPCAREPESVWTGSWNERTEVESAVSVRVTAIRPALCTPFRWASLWRACNKPGFALPDHAQRLVKYRRRIDGGHDRTGTLRSRFDVDVRVGVRANAAIRVDCRCSHRLPGLGCKPATQRSGQLVRRMPKWIGARAWRAALVPKWQTGGGGQKLVAGRQDERPWRGHPGQRRALP